MKKIFSLIAMLAMFVGIADAQIVRSNSSKTITQETVKEPSETIHYVRFGLNLMKVRGDDISSDWKDYEKPNLGYQLVWGFQKPLGPMFWGMEYGLGSRGYKLKDGDAKDTWFAHNGYFSPFNLGYKYAVSGDFEVEGHIGAYVSGDYAGKFVEDDGHDSEDFSIYDADDYSYVDAGMVFGFGVWYNSVGLDFSFQKGFIDMAKDVKVHTSNFMIRLGFKF